MRYWLVMPAAGAGRRFGERVPKQYAPLRGRTVIEWALAPFLADPRCAGAVVALAPGDTWWPKVSERLPAVVVAPGGAERGESVRNALAGLSRRAEKTDWVLVHDAARPCLPAADLDRLLERGSSHTTGAILAQPLADTLKRARKTNLDASGGAEAVTEAPPTAVARPGAAGGAKPSAAADTAQPGTPATIEETVDRSALWRAGTPQMFRYGPLVDALDRAIASKRFPTDESQALEWLGGHPLLVEGSAANIKVTTADDLALAEALLAAREGKGK
jgi:2-C-methyl-D-erythritol 4-phosphate cytidylyltransferase